MTSAKEKKLNAIKSEILEIKEFVTSNKNDDSRDIDTNSEIEIDSNDTFTLTNIVNYENKVQYKDNLTEIKNELYELKSMFIKQEKVLKEILLKIKWIFFNINCSNLNNCQTRQNGW